MPLASGTSLNNAVQAIDGSYTPGAVGIVRKNFGPAAQGAGEQVVGYLPSNGAIVPTSSGVWVKTLFNGTTPVINVGVAGTPALFASALALTAVGFIAFDDAALAAAVPTAAGRNLVVTIGGTGSTVGSVDVMFGIIPG